MIAHGHTEESKCGVGGALQLSTCPGLQSTSGKWREGETQSLGILQL